MQLLRGTATAVLLTALTAIVLVANARLTAVNLRRVAETNAAVGTSHEVLETLQAVLTSLQDAETAERGFVITESDMYLEPYLESRAVVVRHLARLSELTRGEPRQQAHLAAIRPLVDQKLEMLEHAFALRRSRGFDAAREVVRTGAVKRLMEQLRVRVAEMEAEERLLLRDRERTSVAASRTASITNLLALGASLGLLAGAFGAWRGRTRERGRAAELLNEEKEKFRTTLTSIGDGVVVTDHEGRITMLNGTAASLLGCRQEEAAGRPLDEVFRIVNEHTRAAVESPVQKVLRQGKIAGLANHTVLIRRDGGETPIDDSGAPIRDRNGNLVGVVLVFRDIGERREAERELQRRADLLQDQDRRKDRFLAMLSHELRNPLAPIRNAVAVQHRAHPEGEEMVRARTVIERQVAHLSRLVDDLLDVSRIAQGKVLLQKEPVSLNDVVRRTVDDHRGLFSSKGVDLELEEGEPLWVDADPTRLAQVTENLLHNAAKYTSRGGHVAVTLERAVGRARLRVRDDGEGIAKEALASIFKPFVQGEREPGDRGGLGLGLALSRGIVELHGGDLQALSEGPGKGAEFIVSLPSLPNLVRRPEEMPTKRPRSRLRICIIDDSEDAAETLHDLLELEGHDVHVAMDGQAGIDLALAVQPDVVLCDVGMPGLDGLEVARRLRAAGLGAMLVALTGYALAEDVQRTREAGFDYHLAKPTDVELLEAVLARAGGPERSGAGATGLT